MKFVDWLKIESVDDDLRNRGYERRKLKYGPYAGQLAWWKASQAGSTDPTVIPPGQETQFLAKSKPIVKPQSPVIGKSLPPAPIQSKGPKPKLIVVENKPNLVVAYKLPIADSTALRNDLVKHNLWKNGLQYLNRKVGELFAFSIEPGKEDVLKPLLGKYLDISALDEPKIQPPAQPPQAPQDATQQDEFPQTADQPQQEEPATPPTRRLIFEDLGAVDDPKQPPDAPEPKKQLQKMKIYRPWGEVLDQSEMDLRKDLIRLNFPNWSFPQEPATDENGHPVTDIHDNASFRRVYIVAAGFDEYALFGRLLKRFGFDTKQYHKIFVKKFMDPKTGQLPALIEGNRPPDFIETLPAKLPNLGKNDEEFTLYDAQKKGIAFLYSRRKAILGDETGLGKTLQLICAAETKMQEVGGDCLIVTLKSIVDQWFEEILRVIGEKNEDQISVMRDVKDPLDLRKYTIVYYDMFSPGSAMARARTKKHVDELIAHKFKIIIFDELHKVKDETAAKSINLSAIANTVPVKWGASATISSNEPTDVRNQLRILGHPLGFIDSKQFKEDFAGVVTGPKAKKDPQKESLQKKIKAQIAALKKQYPDEMPEEVNAQIEGLQEELKKFETLNDFKRKLRAAENLNRWLHLTGVYLRRKKTDIKEMPDLQHGSIHGEIDHEAYEEGFQRRITAPGFIQTPLTVLAKAREQLAISKVPLTVARVAELVKEGKKVVVFTAFIDAGIILQAKIREAIKKIDPIYEVLTYTSDTPPKERLEVKPRFTHDKRYRVLLMSIKMGGTGIDFPNAAQNMIINDFEWTPESCEQSEGRIYRINTNHSVQIEYMIAHGTLDESLYRRLNKKREIADKIHAYREDYQDEKDPKKANAIADAIIDLQLQSKVQDDAILTQIMKDAKKPTSEGFTFKDYLNCLSDFKEIVFEEENWYQKMRRAIL